MCPSCWKSHEAILLPQECNVLCPTSVCRASSDLDWAVTSCPGMWVPVLLFLGHRGFAVSAALASLVTNTTLSLSVEACSIFVIDTLGCLDTMLRR